jgi:Flp pilus assembly protein TadG
MRYRPRCIWNCRHGAVVYIIALLLVPLMAVLAYAIDLAYIWRTDAELQNAADAAAFAGADQLLAGIVPAAQASAGGSSDSQFRSTATSQAVAAATSVGGANRAGGLDLVVLDSDIALGYIADPALPATSLQGQWQSGGGSPFPNSVQVTVRRDHTVPATGPLPLFFGPFIGCRSVERQATAVATLRSQNISGFQGTGSRLMPLAMSSDTLAALLNPNAPAPAGVTISDNYTVTVPLVSGATPPANVSAGKPDGVSEATIYPNLTAPGNFGLISLDGSNGNGASTIANWIQNGPSASDLSGLGPNGFQAPATVNGVSGLRASEDAPLNAIIGQPRVLPVYSSYSGNGATATYQIVQFVGAVVVAADLKGGSKYVRIQLMPVIDPSATITSSSSGVTSFVYQGVSLSR